MAEATRQRDAARRSRRQCELSGRGAERNDVCRTAAGPGNENKGRAALHHAKRKRKRAMAQMNASTPVVR
eukprot:10259170-Alexandrium_andersonii.AAC.1